MSTHDAIVKHYALLIGIDAYPERPLRSCVADVGKMKTYLRDALPNAYVQTLTAAQETSADGWSEPKSANSIPTLANVISTLDRITTQAQQGDFFYLHYSGHGSREPPTERSSNEATGDLVLVLFSTCEGDQEIYLYGSDLADCLKSMVDKGIFVTLVLDCCHSGAVYRQDSDVRFLPYSPEVASRSPRIIARAPDAPGSCQTSRGVSMLPNWLVNPDGYAILTACGPLETAQEFKLDGSVIERGQRYGALSYFLCLALLECGGVSTKHQQVYSLILAKFRTNCPKQNPVLYGNRHQGFFDTYIHTHLSASAAVMSIQGTLNLPLGLAHGVRVGDTFALHHASATAASTSTVACVTFTGPLSSKLHCENYSAEHRPMSWMAKPIRQSYLQNKIISVSLDVPRSDELVAALQERLLVATSRSDSGPFLFQLSLSTNSEQVYCILDADGQGVANVPLLRCNEVDVRDVCDVIEHLVRYRSVEEISNVDSTHLSPSHVSVSIQTHSGMHSASDLIKMSHNSSGRLLIKNMSKYPIYACALNLGPQWQIENIFRSSYETIPPPSFDAISGNIGGRKFISKVPLHMQEQGWCKDVIKVILTTQPTTFDILELPKLGEPSSIYKGYVNRGFNNQLIPEDWVAYSFSIFTDFKS